MGVQCTKQYGYTRLYLILKFKELYFETKI